MFLQQILRGVIYCIAVVLLSMQLSAQEQLEFPHVSLSQSPQFETIQEQPLSEEVKTIFQKCLSQLEDAEVPRQFFEQDLWDQFEELTPGYYGASNRTQPLQLPPALIELLDMGPVIIPLLLEELDNDLPVTTTLTIFSGHSSIRFFDRLHGNAANRREARILKLSKKCYVGSFDLNRTVPGSSVAATQAEYYQFCVGDVCFVLLGRIVGRDYRPSMFLNKSTHAICSTVFNDQMRIKVQTLWRSPTPCTAVYESLMYDLCTVGITSDGSRDDWEQGNILQITAAHRLIKYFPAQSKRAIQRRLSSLYLTSEEGDSDRVNGVDVVHLIRSIGTTDDPELLEKILALQVEEKGESLRKAVQWVQKKRRALQDRKLSN